MGKFSSEIEEPALSLTSEFSLSKLLASKLCVRFGNLQFKKRSGYYMSAQKLQTVAICLDELQLIFNSWKIGPLHFHVRFGVAKLHRFGWIRTFRSLTVSAAHQSHIFHLRSGEVLTALLILSKHVVCLVTVIMCT